MMNLLIIFLLPANAGAICRDGWVSSSTTRRGTCSHHGGVSKWLTTLVPQHTWTDYWETTVDVVDGVYTYKVTTRNATGDSFSYGCAAIHGAPIIAESFWWFSDKPIQAPLVVNTYTNEVKHELRSTLWEVNNGPVYSHAAANMISATGAPPLSQQDVLRIISADYIEFRTIDRWTAVYTSEIKTAVKTAYVACADFRGTVVEKKL